MYGKTNLLKILMLKVHIGIASMRQLQFVLTTYVNENKGNYLAIYI